MSPSNPVQAPAEPVGPTVSTARAQSTAYAPSTARAQSTGAARRLPDGEPESLAVATAAAAWVGAAIAWAPASNPLWLVAGVVAASVGLRLRRRTLIVVAAAVVGLYLGARADAGYRQVEARSFDGLAEVTADPEPAGFGRRIELRLPDGHLVQATGYGATGWALEKVSVGDRLMIAGRLSPIGDRRWLKTRHIAGRLAIDRFEVVGGPGPLAQVPELVRNRIAAGAETLPHRFGVPPEGFVDLRPLYLGLVIGDDRDQTPGQRIRFRAAGLTHLLAVSGQNVAFVLSVARPFLQRMGRRRRLVALTGVLVVFAMVTRLEPSVLRATATAAIAAWGALSGRERSGMVVLSVAVLCLIVADPFLVHSVGFQLSVAASAGILVAGPAIERRVPGPRWLAGPLATTMSAQLFVSPLLAHYFGPVSLASISANLLAGWAAAAIMTLGLTVGVVAGLVPHSVGQVLQWPSGMLLWWIDTVATVHARLPAPRVGPVEVLVLVILVIGVRARAGSRIGRAVAVAVAAALLAWSAPTSPSNPTWCGPGVGWYPEGPESQSVLIVTATAYARSIEQCFDAGIRQVDVVVVERGGSPTAGLVGALREVVEVGVVMAPPQHRVVGAHRQVSRFELSTVAGPLNVEPSRDGRALQIRLGRS